MSEAVTEDGARSEAVRRYGHGGYHASAGHTQDVMDAFTKGAMYAAEALAAAGLLVPDRRVTVPGCTCDYPTAEWSGVNVECAKHGDGTPVGSGAVILALEQSWHEDQCACVEWSRQNQGPDRGCIARLIPPTTWPVAAVLAALAVPDRRDLPAGDGPCPACEGAMPARHMSPALQAAHERHPAADEAGVVVRVEAALDEIDNGTEWDGWSGRRPLMNRMRSALRAALATGTATQGDGASSRC